MARESSRAAPSGQAWMAPARPSILVGSPPYDAVVARDYTFLAWPAAAGAGAMPQQRCEAYYSGRVQGVGFRYTTKAIAASHAVSGYVRNLPDGRVQLEAEGERAELDAFLDCIADQMRGNIRQRKVDFRPATGEFSSFDIRH